MVPGKCKTTTHKPRKKKEDIITVFLFLLPAHSALRSAFVKAEKPSRKHRIILFLLKIQKMLQPSAFREINLLFIDTV